MSISAEIKQELILTSFRAEVSMGDLCRRAQVPESTFRDWRDRFIAAGTAA
jgi:transposase-like protein